MTSDDLAWLPLMTSDDLASSSAGLGKTAQIVATLGQLSSKHGVSGPYLIIAPLSTIGHWARELGAWSTLRTLVLHGSSADRAMLLKHRWNAPTTEGAPDGAAGAKARGAGRGFWFEVVITTYETLLIEERRMRSVPWYAQCH